jgi:hypothetical protein
MSQHEKFDTADAATAVDAPVSIKGLENLAGFAEDVNNQAIDGMADPAALEAVVKQRFGADVSTQDVTEALQALQEISLGL